MSKSVNMHEAKTHLSRLVAQIRTGAEREIVISVAGKPAARLVAYGEPEKRLLGIYAGQVIVGDDFDSIDEAIARTFSEG